VTERRPEISTALVEALIAEQFPQWRSLPVRPVPRQGWDNRTFRLGDHLSVRLPSADGYVAAVEKENRWLPELAKHLPLPVPSPVAAGRPGAGFPFPWSVRNWLDGDPLSDAAAVDRDKLITDLAGFLAALRQAPAHGPAGGRHSFYRGCHPSAYSEDVERSLELLGDTVDAAACRAVWAQALTSAWPSAPVWFHGDIAVGNLLVRDGRLAAVIDFGTCGVGDPACDLVIAWNSLTAAERPTFHEAVGLDPDTWRRARGWALWKALIQLARPGGPGPAGDWEPILAEVLACPVSAQGSS
jgi:aminoglycoside phosphotransferase (APT) family kinase protein